MARSSDVLQIVINGIDNATPAFRKVAAGAAIMGAAVAAAFVKATIEAGKFEKGLAEISTLLDGDVTPAINQMREELLDMSVEFGQAIEKLTTARYDIISAGFTDAAESSQVLTAASKLAVAGVSDVAVAADILTDALGGLEVGAEKAEHITDILLQTVRKGKVKLEELAQGFGKVFGSAKVAGVSLEELAAAMATATASGVNVTDSITGLNALILAIAAPTEEARKAMEDAGISMDEGFTQAIVDLGNASGESLAKMRELIPSVEALRVAAKIAGNVDLLKKNLLEMNDATGVVQTGFDKMAQTFDFKMAQAKASFRALTIEIGTEFLPVAKEMMDRMRVFVGILRDNSGLVATAVSEFGDLAIKVALITASMQALAVVLPIVFQTITAIAAVVSFMGPKWVLAAVAVGILAANMAEARAEMKETEDVLQNQAPSFTNLINNLAKIAEFASFQLANRFEEMAEAEEKAANNAEKVLVPLRKLLGLSQFDPGAMSSRFRDTAGALDKFAKKAGAVGDDTEIVNRAVDELTEAALDLKDELASMISGEFNDMISNILPDMSELFQALTGDIDAMIRAMRPFEDFFLPSVEEIKAVQGQFDEFGNMIMSVGERAKQTNDEITDFMEQVSSLAEFTAEDFANLAFSIGDSFGAMMGDIAGSLLGLRDGPIMVGRAIKSMVAGAITDIGRLIARLLVAKALMGLFGGGFGALFFSQGGDVPRAAFGLSVPGGGGEFPAVVLPGSPGLDRTLVAAQGGEVIISRQEVNRQERTRRQAQTSPRPAARRRARGRPTAVIQANRPFRTEESILLRDSVTEGIERGERHVV